MGSTLLNDRGSTITAVFGGFSNSHAPADQPRIPWVPVTRLSLLEHFHLSAGFRGIMSPETSLKETICLQSQHFPSYHFCSPHKEQDFQRRSLYHPYDFNSGPLFTMLTFSHRRGETDSSGEDQKPDGQLTVCCQDQTYSHPVTKQWCHSNETCIQHLAQISKILNWEC